MKKSDEKQFVGLIDPRSENVEEQIDNLAHKFAVKSVWDYNQENGIEDNAVGEEYNNLFGRSE